MTIAGTLTLGNGRFHFVFLESPRPDIQEPMVVMIDLLSGHSEDYTVEQLIEVITEIKRERDQKALTFS